MPRMKPMLFNTEMVRATLAGDKTATRRIILNQPTIGAELICENLLPETVEAGAGAVFAWSDGTVSGAPWAEGDILWVREAWGDYRENYEDGEGPYILYRADYPDGAKSVPFPENEKTDYADSWDLPKWHPSIHMPREYARIFLRVKRVRAQLLRDITREEIKAEGITQEAMEKMLSPGSSAPRWVVDTIYKRLFSELWNSTIKPDKIDSCGWVASPWVWVIEYERCEKPEDINR